MKLWILAAFMSASFACQAELIQTPIPDTTVPWGKKLAENINKAMDGRKRRQAEEAERQRLIKIQQAELARRAEIQRLEIQERKLAIEKRKLELENQRANAQRTQQPNTQQPSVQSTRRSIKVAVAGFDDGNKTTKERDKNEATLKARLMAIGKAGSEITSLMRTVNFSRKSDAVDDRVGRC